MENQKSKTSFESRIDDLHEARLSMLASNLKRLRGVRPTYFIAEQIGLSPGTINGIEQGSHNPTLLTISYLEAYFLQDVLTPVASKISWTDVLNILFCSNVFSDNKLEIITYHDEDTYTMELKGGGIVWEQEKQSIKGHRMTESTIASVQETLARKIIQKRFNVGTFSNREIHHGVAMDTGSGIRS
jgi:hypothetical protein